MEPFYPTSTSFDVMASRCHYPFKIIYLTLTHPSMGSKHLGYAVHLNSEVKFEIWMIFLMKDEYRKVTN